MKNVNEILQEREKTHGKYADHAYVTQEMKAACQYKGLDTKLSYEQKEAVDMILHKVGRIIAGNNNEVDHWQDIAGYATLVVRSINDRKEVRCADD